MTAGELVGFRHRVVPVEGVPADAPTLLLLHGTGGDEADLLPVGAALHDHANLLSPRGKVLENGMPRFFRRFAEGVFDFDDVRRRAEELAAFVDAACTEYRLDPARVVAAGYSNGANIAAALLLLYPGVLAGAILFRAMVPVPPSHRRDALSLAAPVPVLIANGRQDPIAPPAEAERLAALLRQEAAEVTFYWHPGGHELARTDLTAAREWLAGQKI